MRYLPDGRLDPAFGQDGVVLTNFGLPAPAVPPPVEGNPPVSSDSNLPSVEVGGLAVDATDRPVLTGSWTSARRWCYPLIYEPLGVAYTARLQVDGSPDPSFDGDSLLLDPSREYASRPLIDGSSILAVGGSSHCYRVFFPRLRLTKVAEDGNIEESFGFGGAIEPTTASIDALALDRFGRTLLLASPRRADSPWRLLRLTRYGKVDPRFAGGKGAHCRREAALPSTAAVARSSQTAP